MLSAASARNYMRKEKQQQYLRYKKAVAGTETS